MLSAEFFDIFGLIIFAIILIIGCFMLEKAKGRLWVNVETDLPVKVEIEGVSSGGVVETKIVAWEFKWDAHFQKSVGPPSKDTIWQ